MTLFFGAIFLAVLGITVAIFNRYKGFSLGRKREKKMRNAYAALRKNLGEAPVREDSKPEMLVKVSVSYKGTDHVSLRKRLQDIQDRLDEHKRGHYEY